MRCNSGLKNWGGDCVSTCTMPILATKYGETHVELTDELHLVVPSEFSKPCISKKPTKAGSIVVNYWNLALDKRGHKACPTLEHAEAFRDSVTWTPEQVFKTVTVAEVLSRKVFFEHYHRLAPQAIEYEAKDVPLDPYWTGAWIGDGTSTKCQITTADQEIVDYTTVIAESYGMKVVQQKNKIVYSITNGNGGRVGGHPRPQKEVVLAAIRCLEASRSEWLWTATAKEHGVSVIVLRKYYAMHTEGTLDEYYRQHEKNPIILALKGLGVWNNKHIPKCYLENSRDVRLKVLAGIIDTDGSLDHGGGYVMRFANKRLLDDVVTLARSLGFKCNDVASYMAMCTNASGGPKACQAYRTRISGGNNLSDIPVLLERKRSKKNRLQRNDQEHFWIVPDAVA